jgi:hypothetical protein
MENQNIIQTIATILQGIESHLADISSKLNLMHESGKEKVSQKEIYSFSNLGGIIGGDKIGGLRGKEKGGNKGGGISDDSGTPKPKRSEASLSDFNTTELASLEKLNEKLFGHLKDELQIDYLSTRQQKIHALKALRKLYKLGYSHAMIEQALFSAFRDEFWNDKIRHLKALANTMKNGELVIMNLLKKNQAQTKMNSPVKAQFKG